MIHTKRRKTRSKKRPNEKQLRTGATAIEFALVAPVLLLIIFCCVEFSRMSLLQNLAQNAAYEACRNVIVEGGDVDDAIDEAERVLGRLGAKETVITVNGGQTIEADTPQVNVRIEIPMHENSLLLPWILFGDRNMVAEISLNTERYQGFFDGGVSTN